MLQVDDFTPQNWESVTWQIVSGTYVRGYKLSACLPPETYLEWVIDRHGLTYPGAISIENAMDEGLGPVWRLTIRQADEISLLSTT
jgi:hypothetical protein